MEHRILLPLRFQIHDLEPFEEFFLSFEVGVQRGGQQRLAETARAAEENERTLLGDFPDQVCLVDIEVILFSQPFEGLDSHGVFADGVHNGRFFRGKGTNFSFIDSQGEKTAKTEMFSASIYIFLTFAALFVASRDKQEIIVVNKRY